MKDTLMGYNFPSSHVSQRKHNEKNIYTRIVAYLFGNLLSMYPCK